MLSIIFVFNKSKNYQKDISKRPDIKKRGKIPASTSLQCLKYLSYIQVPVKMSLRHAKLVCFIQVPLGTSLRRLKLVGFIYVPVRRCKDVSNRSVLLIYQLRCRDDVSVWSKTSKLVTRMGQFPLGIRLYVTLASQVGHSL